MSGLFPLFLEPDETVAVPVFQDPINATVKVTANVSATVKPQEGLIIAGPVRAQPKIVASVKAQPKVVATVKPQQPKVKGTVK